MRLSLIVPGLALAIISSFALATGVLAHATIESVDWDNATNPTRVIATSGEDEISAKPGSYILHVLNVQGEQVDVGTPTISTTDKKVMSVAVKPNLPAGGYKVMWQTLSADDGDEDDGSFTLLLNKPAAPAAVVPAPAAVVVPALTAPVIPAAPAPQASVPARQAPVTPPSTGDAGLLAKNNGAHNTLLSVSLMIAAVSLGLFGLSRKRA